MHLRHLHDWDITPVEAAALQQEFAPRVIREGDPCDVRLVAAADVAYVDHVWPRRPSLARAAAVLMSYPELDVVEQNVIEHPATFPYVPGLLSFREGPALVRALSGLQAQPDLLLVDGQGYAHPRRFGIACHLGLLAGVPTIGCAKSRLVGEHGEPGPEPGANANLVDHGQVIGLVVRTRKASRPLYISTGHMIGLREAADWVLRLCRGRRIPEPIRIADALSKGRASS